MIPDSVVQIRISICSRNKCHNLNSINFNDPCATCPKGHWGRYEITGCEDQNRVAPDTRISASHGKSNASLRPGFLLSTLIFKITGQSTKSCGVCGARMALMDRNGWWWCWKNRKIITGWIVEEAKKRGYEISKVNVLNLFKAAFKEMKKKKS